MGYYGRRPNVGVGVGEAAAVTVGLGAVALVIGTLIMSGGEHAEPEAVGVCASPVTNERVDDDLCGDFGDDGSAIFVGGYHYMVFDSRTYRGDIPAVGQRLPAPGTTGYVRTYPSATKPVAAAPKAGGSSSSIVRGGLGVKGASVGGSSGS